MSACLLDYRFGGNKGQDWTIANEDDEPGVSAGNFFLLSSMTPRLLLLALSGAAICHAIMGVLGRRGGASLEPGWLVAEAFTV